MYIQKLNPTIKTRIILVIIAVAILVVGISTQLFSNLRKLINYKSYFIPKESSVFTFNPTYCWSDDHDDSWWLFGEDGTYYYAQNRDSIPVPRYLKLRKGSEPAIFHKADYLMFQFVLSHTGKEYIEQTESKYAVVNGKKEIVRQIIRTLHLPDSLPISILTRTWQGEYGLQDSLWSRLYYDHARRDSIIQTLTFPARRRWDADDWAVTQESRWGFRPDGKMTYFYTMTSNYDGIIPLTKNQTRFRYDGIGRLIERIESSSNNDTKPQEWKGDSTKVKYLYNAAGVLNDSIMYTVNRYGGWESINQEPRYSLVESWHYIQTKLSRQFNLEVSYKHYEDTITALSYADSAFVRLKIKDKETGEVLDHIFVRIEFLGSGYYEDKTDARSYTTGFHANRETYDNYFGNIVVADLNFDGKDDLAVVYGSGVSSGPYCNFYMQTGERKFVKDNYLTDYMTYFPNEINPLRRELTTYAHASAVELCKSIYRLDSLTNKWRRVSKTYIGY